MALPQTIQKKKKVSVQAMRSPTRVDLLGRVISRRARVHWQEIRSLPYKLTCKQTKFGM